MEMKFIVFKCEDARKLSRESKAALRDVCGEIDAIRLEAGKQNTNRYLVINADEPYAQEVVEILKRNGHWG